jgi:hypothetical protein
VAGVLEQDTHRVGAAGTDELTHRLTVDHLVQWLANLSSGGPFGSRDGL